jgi:hypothetical protein
MDDHPGIGASEDDCSAFKDLLWYNQEYNVRRSIYVYHIGEKYTITAAEDEIFYLFYVCFIQ